MFLSLSLVFLSVVQVLYPSLTGVCVSGASCVSVTVSVSGVSVSVNIWSVVKAMCLSVSMPGKWCVCQCHCLISGESGVSVCGVSVSVSIWSVVKVVLSVSVSIWSVVKVVCVSVNAWSVVKVVCLSVSMPGQWLKWCFCLSVVFLSVSASGQW